MKRQLSLYVEVCSLKKVVSSVSPDNSAAEYTGLKKGPGTKEKEIESLKADLLEKQLAYELFTARNIQLGIAVAKSKSERGDQHVEILGVGINRAKPVSNAYPLTADNIRLLQQSSNLQQHGAFPAFSLPRNSPGRSSKRSRRSGVLQPVMRHHLAHGTGQGERPLPSSGATRGWLTLSHSRAHSSSPFGFAACSGGAGHTLEILPCMARGCDSVNPIQRGGSGATHGPLHAGGGHDGVAYHWGV